MPVIAKQQTSEPHPFDHRARSRTHRRLPCCSPNRSIRRLRRGGVRKRASAREREIGPTDVKTTKERRPEVEVEQKVKVLRTLDRPRTSALVVCMCLRASLGGHGNGLFCRSRLNRLNRETSRLCAANNRPQPVLKVRRSRLWMVDTRSCFATSEGQRIVLG